MASEAPPLVLLLDYRAAIETVDLDAANEEAWREALDAFGYQQLDESTFLQDLALSSSSEVMMALCPYTTKEEWGPALAKRDLRLERDVDEMCYANVVPVPGVVNLITNAAKHRRTIVVLLSPFPEGITTTLMKTCGLGTVVDAVVCYTSLDVALLEALAAFRLPPPTCPSKFDTAALEASIGEPDGSIAGADIVAFVSTSTAAKKMRGFGASIVGVLHNSCDQEVDEEDNDSLNPQVLPGRDDAAAMREAGCDLCVLNFEAITPAHLGLLRSSTQSPIRSANGERQGRSGAPPPDSPRPFTEA